MLLPSLIRNVLVPFIVVSGKRSAMAATLLAKEGYTVTNLLGGIIAWTEAKKKTVKE